MLHRPLHVLVMVFTVLLFASCGPGWSGYEDNYSEVTEVTGGEWEGSEFVYVVLGESEIEVHLEGMQIYDFNSTPAVLLSELIIQSGLADEPELYRYNFTATDGYDLFIKRYEDISLLPSWEEMKHGYLYVDSRFEDLTSGWTKHPWGSAECAYNVKWMNGGWITLMIEE